MYFSPFLKITALTYNEIGLLWAVECGCFFFLLVGWVSSKRVNVLQVQYREEVVSCDFFDWMVLERSVGRMVLWRREEGKLVGNGPSVRDPEDLGCFVG